MFFFTFPRHLEYCQNVFTKNNSGVEALLAFQLALQLALQSVRRLALRFECNYEQFRQIKTFILMYNFMLTPTDRPLQKNRIQHAEDA